MAEASDVADLELVGAGELPAEFRRVNWGVFFVAPFWAAFYGLRWIVIGYVATFVGYLVITNAVLWFAPDWFVPVRSTLDAAFFPLLAVSGVVLALVANRYTWHVQAGRLESSGANPIPVWRLRKSQRFWFGVATALCILSVLTTLIAVVTQPGEVFGSPGDMFASFALPLLYAYDLYLRHRSGSAG